MRFLGKDDSRFYSNALPGGIESEHELIELYRDALDRQAGASEAWAKIMTAHAKSGSQWSAVVHCALACGMTSEDLRLRLGASPSTLSRWLNGLVQPTRMLRNRLEKELVDFTDAIVKQIRDASSQLTENEQPSLALAAAGHLSHGSGGAPPPGSALKDTHMRFVDRLDASFRIFVDDSGTLYVAAEEGRTLPKVIHLQKENGSPVRLEVEAVADGFARLSDCISLVELREEFADENGRIPVLSLS